MPRRRVRRWSASLAVVAALLVACSDGSGGQLAEQTDVDVEAVRPGEPVPVAALEVPASAEAVADELAAVESGLRDDDRDPERLADLGRRQQLAYRALAAHPAWVDHVLATVPSRLHDAVRHNVAADAALGELTGDSSPPIGLPDWQIVAPLPAGTLRGYYAEAEAQSAIPWPFLAAINLVETRMGRISGTSSAGAHGPMQFIPATWDAYGEGDVTDDRDAILAAGRYLADRGGPEDMDSALFAYNNDTRYVRAVRSYATVMLADHRAYDGYHGWQIFFAAADGTVLLPEGYGLP